MLYSDTKPCPIFLKLVFVKPRMSRWNVWTWEQNTESSFYCLCLLYPQYPKFGPPKWGVLHEIKGNIKIIRQFPNMAKLSRPSPNFAHKRSFLNITEDLFDIHGIEFFASVNYFAHKLCLLIALFEFTKRPRRSKTDAHRHLRGVKLPWTASGFVCSMSISLSFPAPSSSIDLNSKNNKTYKKWLL